MWILLYPRDLCGPPSAPSAHPLCRGACVHLTQFLRSTLCVMGLVCSCLTSWPRALCSRDCVHVIRLPWPASASRGLVWTCSSSPRPSSTMWGLCALVSSHCSHSLSWGLFVLLLAVPGGTCALPKFYMPPPVGTPVPPFAPAVCRPSHSASWARPLCCKGCVRWLSLYAVPLSVPRAATCLGPQSMSC